MAIYYVDYSVPVANTGDGSSYNNRASRLQNASAIGTLAAGTDEVRIKGNPITSLGTAKILNQGRPNQTYYDLNNWYSISGNIHYSTTTGETYIAVGAMSQYGWLTGDKIMIFDDPYASSNSQPSLVGIWEITTDGTDSTSNFKIKLDGYTANSNGTNSSGSGPLKWLPGNEGIKLNTTGLTKSIASRDADRSAWTGVSGVTTSVNNNGNFSAWSQTDNCRFHASDFISVPSNASVGKLAHYQLPSTLDLSAYEQISFLCRATSPQAATASDSIRLCSDTSGNTTVHTIPIDLRNGSEEFFHSVVKDFGAALGTSIKSIALYRDTTTPILIQYFFENFIACKDSSDADSITHNSCIGLNDNSTNNKPIWYDIDFIWDDFVFFCSGSSRKNIRYSYYGSGGIYWSQTGASVNIYKCEPFLVEYGFHSNWDLPSFSNPTYSTLGTFVTISGGWNDTDMTTTSGGNGYATIVKGQFTGRGLYWSSRNNWHIKDLYWHQFDYPVYVESSYRCWWENIGTNNSRRPFLSNQSYEVWGLGLAYCNGFYDYANLYINQHKDSPKANYWFNLLNNGRNSQTFSTLKGQNFNANERREYQIELYREDGYAYNAGQNFDYEVVECDTYISNSGLTYPFNYIMKANGGFLKIGTFIAHNGAVPHFTGHTASIDNFNVTRSLHPTNSNSNFPIFGSQLYGHGFSGSNTDLYFGNGTCSGPAQLSQTCVARLNGVVFNGVGGVFLYNTGHGGDEQLQLKNLNDVSGNDKTYRQTHTFTTDTSVRKTASGTSLKAEVTQTNFSYKNPNLKLGSILVEASSQVTVTVWCYVPSGETVRLIIPEAGWLGVTRQEASHQGSTAANTWTQLSTSFTPTTAGQLDVEVHFSNNTVGSAMYIDDMGVSQA